MRKKHSKSELFEAGICPDCGGKLYFEGIEKKEDLIKLGFVQTEAGFYEQKPGCSHRHTKPVQIMEDQATAKEQKRAYNKQRQRSLRSAENKRSQRNLKRLAGNKRGGFGK